MRHGKRTAVQEDTFKEGKHSLSLIYNEHFLLRSKTRYSEFDKLDTSRKLTLSLRSLSHFTNLVIKDTHKKDFHNGVDSTLDFLRSKYWLIRRRQSIKSLLQQCVTCKYIHMKTVILFAMPALSKFRLDYSVPYQNIGLD